MKKIYSTISAFLVFLSFSSFSQTLINKEWESFSGHPSFSYKYFTGAANRESSHYFYGVGNTYTSSQQENVFIGKGNDEGGVLWVQQFDVTGNKDFAIDISQRGSVVNVVGLSIDSASGESQFITLQLNDSTGAINWSHLYGHSGSNIPSKILTSSNGDIFVCGIGAGTPDQGMVILKYDNSGSLLWTTRWDQSSKMDGATAMVLDSAGTLSVTGYSGTTFSSWDFVTLQINTFTGSIDTAVTNSNGNGGFSRPVGLDKDANGNIFLVGTAINPTNSNAEIKLISYDSTMQENWVVHYDSTYPTEAVAMQNDLAGGEIVLGTRTIGSEKQMVLLRFNKSDGSMDWERFLSGPNPGEDAEAGALEIDYNTTGNIFITGSIGTAGHHRMTTACYSPEGDLKWIKDYKHSPNSDDIGGSIEVDDEGNPMVTGISHDGDSTQYVTVKYAQMEQDITLVTDTTNGNYLQNQILVRFNPNLVNQSFVNNREIQFTKLDSVIPDSVIVIMSDKCNYDFHGTIVSKIMQNMITADSISITRGGDTIAIPKFWSSLKLKVSFPGREEKDMADSLDMLQPYIFYASPNHSGIFDCGNSDPNTYVSAWNNTGNGINWCPAYSNNQWGNYDNSQSGAKVGVYDSGINSTHEDLQFGGATKVLGGKDYTATGTPLILTTPNSDTYGHGTAVTGIIGAETNNGKGMPGVAGGNGGSMGCKLYCNKIGTGVPTISTSDVYNAIISDVSSTGLGLDITNSSFHYSSGDQFLHDAYRFAAMNGVVSVCASGSTGINERLYPASYKNPWILKVGATNGDGDQDASSTNGYGVDVLAPGRTDLYRVLSNQSDTYTSTINGFDAKGSSISAGFVTGTAALMLGYLEGHGDRLAPEDVQHMIRLGANAFNLSGGSMYVSPDDAARLDIGKTMSLISYPKYHIRHITASTDLLGSSRLVEDPDKDIYLSTEYELTPSSPNTPILKLVPPGAFTPTYKADIWQVEMDVPVDIPSNEEIVSVWPVATLSDYWDYLTIPGKVHTSELDPDPNPSFIKWVVPATNPPQATMRGYTYHFTKDPAGNAMDLWIPFDIADLPGKRMTLSVYTDIPNLHPTGIDEETKNKLAVSASPSPAGNKITVEYFLPANTYVNLGIWDMSGRMLISEKNPSAKAGDHSSTFDISSLSSGIYSIQLNTNEERKSIKFIKE